MAANSTQKAVIFDLDGTLIYKTPEGITARPGALDAIRVLKEKDCKLFIVRNVHLRGNSNERELEEVTKRDIRSAEIDPDLFDAIKIAVTTDREYGPEVVRRKKAELFQNIMSENSLSRENVVAVGDTRAHEGAAAEHLGIKFVLVEGFSVIDGEQDGEPLGHYLKEILAKLNL